MFPKIREDAYEVKKRLATPPYSLNSVQQHTQKVETVLAGLLINLDESTMIPSGSVCDLGNVFQLHAMDVCFKKKASRRTKRIEPIMTQVGLKLIRKRHLCTSLCAE